MERLWQDIRVSLRGLWKDRSFTLTTVATLALCLAANVAIFAVVDGVLLKPLPFDHADRLVTINNAIPARAWPSPPTVCRTITTGSTPSRRSRASRCTDRPARPSAVTAVRRSGCSR